MPGSEFGPGGTLAQAAADAFGRYSARDWRPDGVLALDWDKEVRVHRKCDFQPSSLATSPLNLGAQTISASAHETKKTRTLGNENA